MTCQTKLDSEEEIVRCEFSGDQWLLFCRSLREVARTILVDFALVCVLIYLISFLVPEVAPGRRGRLAYPREALQFAALGTFLLPLPIVAALVIRGRRLATKKLELVITTSHIKLGTSIKSSMSSIKAFKCKKLTEELWVVTAVGGGIHFPITEEGLSTLQRTQKLPPVVGFGSSEDL